MSCGAGPDGLEVGGGGAVVPERLPPRREPIRVEPHPQHQLAARPRPAVHELEGRRLVVGVVGDPLQHGGAGSAHRPLELEYDAVRRAARVDVGAGQPGAGRAREHGWAVGLFDDLDPGILGHGPRRDLDDRPDPAPPQHATLVDIGDDLGGDLAKHPERCGQRAAGLLDGVVDRPPIERRHGGRQRTDPAARTDPTRQGVARQMQELLDLGDRRERARSLGVAPA